ncbi:unnamed protein product [Microthlaspi erraticum]|uniref:Uncharacterized protein n=1 Tax=Microthlaspi erraticum TaxID=1685480 RepID=A0A6D2I6Q5_9BRAS|nr:unnamed protein product [Microthlaspi erraticum]
MDASGGGKTRSRGRDMGIGEAFGALAKAQQLLLNDQERDYILTQLHAAKEPVSDALKTQPFRCINPLVSKKIIQMDVIQVEEKGFYVRFVCNKGYGVAPSLYKSSESLTSFQEQNSNQNSPSSDRYLLTYTLDSLNLPNLKLWITGSLLNKGFEKINASRAWQRSGQGKRSRERLKRRSRAEC